MRVFFFFVFDNNLTIFVDNLKKGNMIRLNAFVQVGLSSRNKLLEIAKELVELSLKEEGCIAYDIFESSTRNDVLLFCETWEDEASLEAHAKSSHFAKLFPKIQELGSVKLEKFVF